MALSAGEFYSGGQVCDTRSRTVMISETTGAVLSAGEFYSGGFLRDVDGRMVICQDTAHSALSAGEQYTAGDVRDSAGRVVCAAETVNTAISAGSQFSGGFLRDSKGRRIIAVDTLGAALSAGEMYSSGQVFDSAGRLALASEGAVGITLKAHTIAGSTDAANVTTAAIDTTGATLLVAAQSSSGARTFSDSKSNTWTALAFTGNPNIQMFYTSNPIVGTGHTFSSLASANPSIAVAAFSGTVTSGLADINQVGVASLATPNPGSATPAHPGELIVCATSVETTATAVVISSGLTITDQNALLGGNHFGVGLAYLVQGAAAAINPTWSGTTLTGTASMASFQ